MASTIDEKTSNQIGLVYTAKNIAPYLEVIVPEIPKQVERVFQNLALRDIIYKRIEKLHSAYLFLTDKKAYEEKKEHKARDVEMLEELIQSRERADADFVNELRDSGLVTKVEQDAYFVAHFAGLCMGRLTSRAEPKEGLEILETNDHYVKKSRVSPELFEEYLSISVKEGIASLENKYWIPVRGVEKPQIVNPDFEHKATDWLKIEVYSKTDGDKEVRLLEGLTIRQEAGSFIIG